MRHFLIQLYQCKPIVGTPCPFPSTPFQNGVEKILSRVSCGNDQSVPIAYNIIMYCTKKRFDISDTHLFFLKVYNA